jgi:hypothetical protein
MGPGECRDDESLYLQIQIFTAVIVRLDRTIQYAAAYRSFSGASGILDRPIKSGSVWRSLSRHCERSEAIHACNIKKMDCFVAMAPSNDGETRHTSSERHTFAFPRRDAPEVCKKSPPQKSEGVGNAGRRCTRSLACNVESTRV